ncbi:MAG TPA: sulfate adenylyltransferase [Candidatus Acidoferrales bacterium]
METVSAKHPKSTGSLVDRVLPKEAQAEARARAARLPAIDLNSRAASDLLLLATGAFTPLEGFTDFKTSSGIVENMRLPDGTVWPFPILLQTEAANAKDLRRGTEVTLKYRGEPLALLHFEESFAIPHEEWAKKMFGTAEAAHPGVAGFLSGGDVSLAGEVDWFGDTSVLGLDENWLAPKETRAAIAQRGWKTVAGFQTRNPVHRAHEYVLRTALEVTDGLLLHPLVGETRPEDIPADVRMRCYRALLDEYLPREHVLFAVLPAWMRYGGPREAVLHAVVRRNFGCTHFLVGRDHAGVGGYYGPYDAQHLLRSLAGEGLGIAPICFDEVFYCRRCSSMASKRTCAHPVADHLILSGTEVRRRLREGLALPEEFTRPQVAAILSAAAQ